MTFKKMSTDQRPPRQWAIVGYPGSGKSTFAAQMAAPALVIDADHRFSEVVARAAGDIFELSDVGADNVDPERIAALLRQNMPGAGIRTIVVDSLTSIIAPLVTQAVMNNDAGRNKNRIAGFKPKALAMRLLQDEITRWGAHTLWIYHLRDGRDAQANSSTTTSISIVELARLRRSLNMVLRIVVEGDKRGVMIDWARRGRSGMTLWDDTGFWQGMPERIEVAVYDGLTQAEQAAIEEAQPAKFNSREEAIAWGWEQGCFRDAVHAQNAYDKCKATEKPASATEMWAAWIADVERRIQELEDDEAAPPIHEGDPAGDAANSVCTKDAAQQAPAPEEGRDDDLWGDTQPAAPTEPEPNIWNEDWTEPAHYAAALNWARKTGKFDNEIELGALWNQVYNTQAADKPENARRFLDAFYVHVNAAPASRKAPARTDNRVRTVTPAPTHRSSRYPRREPIFGNIRDALDWAMGEGAFDNRPAANTAYTQLKNEHKPGSAGEMYAIWIGYVSKLVRPHSRQTV